MGHTNFTTAAGVVTAMVATCLTSVSSLALPPPATNRSADFNFADSINARLGVGGYNLGGSPGNVRHRPTLLMRLRARSNELANSRGGGSGGRGSSSIRCSSAAGAQEEGAFVLEGVKNIRDLGCIGGSGIAEGRIFRTGHLSDATEADVALLRDVTGLRTLVDLRSATELERDKLIHGGMYEGFVSVGGLGTGVWEGQEWDQSGREENEKALPKTGNGDDGVLRKRYFVSLIDESVYKKGVFQRMRRRHKAAVVALAPVAMVSRRCTAKARSIFLREINEGGLVLLNELVLQYSGEGINRVLRLLASRERHPVALYCTAGKDRTGLVVALTLSVLGVPDDAIVDDYVKSDAAYKDLGNKDAMVGALAQEDLNPEVFLSAPRHVMEDVLRFIRTKYGSIDAYLDSISFDAEWRGRLRSALLTE